MSLQVKVTVWMGSRGDGGGLGGGSLDLPHREEIDGRREGKYGTGWRIVLTDFDVRKSVGQS